MFDDITFESILESMLSTIDDEFDKREGSLIYNALAPAALELKKMYINLDCVLNEGFADTASREYLIKHAFQRGIVPLSASKAVLNGLFNISISLGDRFSLGDLNYVAIEKIDDNNFKMQCETAGTIGNSQLGRLTPIEYISGLTSCELTSVLIFGEDEESTEDLRERYMDSLDTESFGGNKRDYIEKTNAISGVGGTKVYPVWNGGGTVKVEIMDSAYSTPNQTLIDSVKEVLDPDDGDGTGVVPIGHDVTVVGVASETIDIQFFITYESGYVWADVQQSFYDMVDEYFLELKKGWEDASSLVIRVSQLEVRALEIQGILDVQNTLIEGAAANYTVTGLPVRGAVVG